MSKTFKDYLKESGLQYYTGVKKHGEEYMKKAAKAGREGASQEELGRLKDKYSKAEKKKKTPEATLEEADKVIFKGKEIDLTKIDYTMRDFSDGMIELNSPVFYTDGTEVADEDLADLNDMPEMIDWMMQDYMDNQAPQAEEIDRMKEFAPNDGGSGSENSPLKRWYEKYNQYKSADARNLADGMFDFYLSSGVDLDTVEKGEYEALVKKHGQDKVSGRALQYIDEMPITSAMLDDFRKIMGSVDEETVEKAANMLDMDEDSTTEVDRIKELAGVSNDFVDEETYDGDDFYNNYGDMWYNEDEIMDEAEYQGRKVKLGKPMRGDVKKFKVYVRDPKTKNIKKVNFGDPNMKIKKSNPARRRSFRARHNCDNPGPRTKARYWSCRKW